MMSGRESETECECEEADSDLQTRKVSSMPKKCQVLQRFRVEYAVEFAVVWKSTVGDSHAYCVIFNCDFSIRHGGIGDIDKHVQSAKNVAKVESSAPLRKIEHFFAESKDLSVMQAEALFTQFIIEHNIPIENVLVVTPDYTSLVKLQELKPSSNFNIVDQTNTDML